MSKIVKFELNDRREFLRQQLLAQRIEIARKLDLTSAENNRYPRSMTMRLLTQRPELAVELIIELVALLVGARFFRSLNTALAVARLLKSISDNRERPLPQDFHNRREADG